MSEAVHSRHRLPPFYRRALTICWLLPGLLLILALVYGHGMSVAFFDPRLLLALGIMALPAVYVWQAGIDVTETGVITRMLLPRFYAYATLSNWEIRREAHGQLVAIWGDDRAKIYEAHLAHLTRVSLLVAALRHNVPTSDWCAEATINHADD